jgi:hypothetical protein
LGLNKSNLAFWGLKIDFSRNQKSQAKVFFESWAARRPRLLPRKKRKQGQLSGLKLSKRL